MIYPRERLIEMSANLDHSLIVHLILAQEETNRLLKKLVGEEKEVAKETVTAIAVKNKGGRPRKEAV